MFEGGVDVERQPGAGFEIDLSAEQRREGVHGGAATRKFAEEHPQHGAGHSNGLGRIVGEVAAGVAVGTGQRHPQLNPVQDRRRGGRDLRVADAHARRHQVQFTRPDHRVHTGAVAVFHLAAEQPADGLQPGVRMRRHVHPGAAARPRVVRSGRRNTMPRSATAPAEARCDARGWPAGRPTAPPVDAAHRRMSMPRKPLRRGRYRCCSRIDSSVSDCVRTRCRPGLCPG